ncbi:MAG: HEPN domain-containing protein [Candidatus Bathyarchaeota archaeon]|nr:HEPN domain-containing protein [Candidatus Bathyarchaeota archaeon]
MLVDAEDFLGAAKDLLKTGRWSKVCFDAQQAAEIALKAALNSYGLERRSHSVTALLEELISLGEDLKHLRDVARILDLYYIPTRYANVFPSGPASSYFTRVQAEEAVKFAEAILKEARRIVGRREVEE